MAVIKADAYGHGSVIIAKELSELWVDKFAVFNINEAIGLINNRINTAQILILGYTSVENAELLCKYNVTQTLLCEEYAELLSRKKCSERIRAEFAIDTGMNSIEIDSDDVDNCKRIITRYPNIFDIE